MLNLGFGSVCTIKNSNIHMDGWITRQLLLPTGLQVNQIMVGQVEILKTVSLCCRKMDFGMMLTVKTTENTFAPSPKLKTSPLVGTIRVAQTDSPHSYIQMEAFIAGYLMQRKKLINRQRLTVLVEPMMLNWAQFLKRPNKNTPTHLLMGKAQ